MFTSKKETILNKLGKNGLDDGSIAGYKVLRIKPNGDRNDPLTNWYIVIENLKDPNDSMTDHFTSYFPSTIKAAIAEMQR